MSEDQAVAIHRLRQYEFDIIAKRSVDYAGLLVAPCTCCHAPRASIFSSSICFNADDMQWEVYCVACKDKADGTLLTAHYDSVRCGTWIAQFGIHATGECVACCAPVDFCSFHRAHDRADKEGGANSVRNSYVSCQTCNVSTGIRPFAKVIADTRAHMGRALLRERSDASMVESGIAWLLAKKPLGYCPWDTVVLPRHLRYTCDFATQQRIESLDRFKFQPKC